MNIDKRGLTGKVNKKTIKLLTQNTEHKFYLPSVKYTYTSFYLLDRSKNMSNRLSIPVWLLFLLCCYQTLCLHSAESH